VRTDLGPKHAVAKRFTKQQKQIKGLLTRDVLQNASIDQGGLTVRNGGGIDIEDGGMLTVDGDAVFNGSLTVPTGTLNTGGDLSAGGKITAGTSVNAGSSVNAGTALNGATLATTGNAHVGNHMTIDGTTTMNDVLTADPGMSSLDIHSRVLSVGYVSVYCDSSGRLGNVPSARRFKQDIHPVVLTEEVQGILHAALVNYRYIAAVEEYGDDAPVEQGMIAEDIEDLGLGGYVSHDAEGTVHGINYERLVIPLIATVQALDARLRALENDNGTNAQH
jgi:hypothetical protein